MTQHHLSTIHATSFGFKDRNDFVCNGFQKEALTALDVQHLPSLDPSYIFNFELMLAFGYWHSHNIGEPCYLSGPAGAGKTSFVRQFAASINQPVVSITARPRMDRRELIGHWALKDGQTVWVPGPAELAYRYGWLLLINEASVAPSEMWVSCNDILEGLPIENELTMEVIPRHPMTRVVFTDNTRGMSTDISAGFLGRNLQDRSMMDRCWHLRFNGLTQEQEEALFYKEFRLQFGHVYPNDCIKRAVRGTVQAAFDSRSRAYEQNIGFDSNVTPISFRTVRRFLTILFTECSKPEIDFNLQAMMNIALLNCLSDNQRQALSTIMFTSLGQIDHVLRTGAKELNPNWGNKGV